MQLCSSSETWRKEEWGTKRVRKGRRLLGFIHSLSDNSTRV